MQGYSGTDLYTSSVPDTTNMNNLNTSRMHQLHRSPSRQFDVYGQIPQAPNNFFDSNRGFPNSFSSLDTNAQNYELNGAQTWNHNNSAFNANGFGSLGPIGSSGATTRMRSARGRTGLPSGWLENEQPVQSGFPSMDSSRGGGAFAQRQSSAGSDPDDELILTAIVIKNIPFAVRKEQLMNLMAEMNLPLPYAFNYHFDNGVFRGLAFANFTSPEETAAVIEALNMYELSGRKLRVEYKKMLPLEQRERIEREKRQRRGQLEEQHRPIGPSQLHNYPSMSSIASHPAPSTSPNPQSQSRSMPPNVDMNDPMCLKWYTDLIHFKTNDRKEVYIFDKGLGPAQRRTVHTLAHQLGLNHESVGDGDKRQVHVYKPGAAHISPPMGHNMEQELGSNDSSRRGLTRASTTEFSDNRHPEPSYNSTLRGQSSLNIIPSHDLGGFGSNPNLRTARSVADLRYNTPSPVYSTTSASFGGPANGLRLQQIDGVGMQNGQTPLLTPASSNPTLGNHRDENVLANGFNSLSLGTGLGNSGSPRRLRPVFSWDHPDQQQQQQQPVTAPIGSNRGNIDNRTQPLRQPAIPTHDRGAGFRRPNGHQSRGSDEYRSPPGPEIIVE